MPRNSSGVYSLPVAAFVPGTTIVASQVNSDFSDIASTLTLSLATTGVSSMTGPIKASSGTVGQPSYTFASELTSGRYYIGANQYADAVNGAAIVSYGTTGISVTGTINATVNITKNGVDVDAFASGTKMLFFQTAAPTGWTKNVTLDNGTIRLVSGTVGADGGSLDFTTVFSNSRAIAANQLPNMNISTTDPTHNHNYTVVIGSAGGIGNGASFNTTTTATTSSLTGITAAIDNTARGGVAQQNLQFAVKYADAIRASKN